MILDINVQISDKPIEISSCINWIMSDECGGINLFIGTVRSSTQRRKVIQLEFEAYENMALNEMRKIGEQVMDRWPVQKILIHHRTGILKVGEIPVIIAVSAAHRAAAFEACSYAIDTLKQTVPIWKKEVFTDGEVWVSAHP